MCPKSAEMDDPADPLQRVRRFLEALAPTLEPLVFDQKMETSEAAAERLGVQVGQVAKSILFKSNDTYGLFVTAGDVRVDRKVVKRLLGGKKPRIARPEEVVEVTGFQVGAVCPFALATDIPVYVDASLQRFDNVYTAAGVPESLLPIRFDRLVQITGGTVVEAGSRSERADVLSFDSRRTIP